MNGSLRSDNISEVLSPAWVLAGLVLESGSHKVVVSSERVKHKARSAVEGLRLPSAPPVGQEGCWLAGFTERANAGSSSGTCLPGEAGKAAAVQGGRRGVL